MISEIVGTVTFTKPTFNKWRVLINTEMEGHALVPPVSEMMFFKLTEVFAESIPVTVLQVNTVLTSDKPDAIVLLAMLSSAVFVSEAVTYMTFIKDISAESRRTGKLFYGFVPLSGIRRWIMKGSMHMLSFCQLMGKSIAIALLTQMGGRTLAITVLSCEMGVYLLFKVARHDLRYRLKLPHGASMFITLFVRIVVKVIADFTGKICDEPAERAKRARPFEHP